MYKTISLNCEKKFLIMWVTWIMWHCGGRISFFWDMTLLSLGNEEVRKECGQSSLTCRPLKMKTLCTCQIRESTVFEFQGIFINLTQLAFDINKIISVVSSSLAYTFCHLWQNWRNMIFSTDDGTVFFMIMDVPNGSGFCVLPSVGYRGSSLRGYRRPDC
jgi:hypothetical protein